MTNLDLTPILTRVNAAEPGPWCAVEHPMEGDHPDGWPLITIQSESGDRREVASVIEDEVASASEKPRENAEFIAAARTDVPRMAAEIQRQREVIQRLIGFRNVKVAEADQLADRLKQVRAAAEKAEKNAGFIESRELLDLLGEPHPAETRPAVVFDATEVTE